MAKLSRNAIAMYARAAGLSGDAVDIAVAVALAESGGDPTQRNPVPPDNSYGLWQINMLGQMGADRRAKFNLSSNSDLYDPATNARVMAALSNGGSNWTPWSTYTDGKYKRYLKDGAGEADQADWDIIPSPGDLVPDGVESFFSTITNPHTWVRVGYVAGGAILVFIGLQVIIRQTPPVKKAQDIASGFVGGKIKAARGARQRRTTNNEGDSSE